MALEAEYAAERTRREMVASVVAGILSSSPDAGEIPSAPGTEYWERIDKIIVQAETIVERINTRASERWNTLLW
jgi:hypothetical protein